MTWKETVLNFNAYWKWFRLNWYINYHKNFDTIKYIDFVIINLLELVYEGYIQPKGERFSYQFREILVS